MINLIENSPSEPDGRWRWVRNKLRRIDYPADPPFVLEKLSKALFKELKQSLKSLLELKHPDAVRALQVAIDNLCSSRFEIEKSLAKRNLLTSDVIMTLLDDEMERTQTLLEFQAIVNSRAALRLTLFTLNQLFCAKQRLKNSFGIAAPRINPQKMLVNEETASVKQLRRSDGISHRKMIITSSILYQLHQSLFPAERMMVAAGIRNGDDIEIGGVFEVTGKASAANVQASPDQLGRALIAMEESNTHFAWWIHSHPGRGKSSTNPSSIDLNQERDWLKDYSPDLVNAIMVKDRFIRFWGISIDEKRVTIKIVGSGVKKVEENVFKLES